MRTKIIETSKELFLTFGFKSITMDDIASSLGVSKKTIYTHFKNKTELVSEVTSCLFETICTGIDIIHKKETNPIIELFEIKRFVMQHLNDEKSSPQYQLQKYYPKIYLSLKEKQFNVMQECIKENLIRGVEHYFFRKSIHIEFIARIYFNGIIGIKDKDLFPLQHFPISELMNNHLEYHLRGISTEKGITELEKQLIRKHKE